MSFADLYDFSIALGGVAFFLLAVGIGSTLAVLGCLIAFTGFAAMVSP